MSLIGKNKGNLSVIICIALLVITDLASKYLIFTHDIDTALTTPMLNAGGAWSINISTDIIIMITILILMGFIYLYHTKAIRTESFILLYAGALGNLYDRFIFSGVRDRIDIGPFPVFNIADICITIGVILIAFQYKKQSREQRH